MTADLSGEAALVTGAASGIGRASAVAFASAGASVALLDIDAEGLADTAATVRAAGTRAEVLVADVRDLQAVTCAVGRAVQAFGRLDAALNNAGMPGPYVPLDEYSEEDFMRILEVDLVGVWRCMRAEIRHMRAQGTGAIVNTSSMLGAAAMPDNQRKETFVKRSGMVWVDDVVMVLTCGSLLRVMPVCAGWRENAVRARV